METDLDALLKTLLALALAALAALALLRLGSAAFVATAPRDAEAVPVLRILAMATAGALGAALLTTVRDPTIFLPERLFAEDGPWAAPLHEVLLRQALPRADAPAVLLRVLTSLDGAATLAAWAAFLGLLAGAIAAFRLWHGPAAPRAFAAFLLLALQGGLLLHAAAHLAAWLAAQLGFWLFAVALILFQRRRYRAHAAH